MTKLLIEIDLDEPSLDLFRGPNAVTLLMDSVKEVLPGLLKAPDIRELCPKDKDHFCIYEAGPTFEEMAVRVMVLKNEFVRDRVSKDYVGVTRAEQPLSFVTGG